MTVPATEVEISSASGFRIYQRVIDCLTNERTELLNITGRIGDAVRASGIRSGLVHVQSLHTTTAILLNEWQDALLDDIRQFFEGVVVRDAAWKHNDPQYSDCERKNADSHLRGMLFGQSVSLQVRDGFLLLGTWQSIILAEFDGPRNRSIAVQISGV